MIIFNESTHDLCHLQINSSVTNQSNQTLQMTKTQKRLTLQIAVIALTLLQGVNSQYKFTYYDTSNTNSNFGNLSALATILNNYASICTSAPPTTLNLCNSTCLNCLSTSASKCSTCSEGYYLDETSCLINNTNYNYSYYSYLGLNKTHALNTVASLRYTSSNASLTANRIVSICMTSSYEIQAAGVFLSSDVINLQFYRIDPIDKIQIKLNFISLVQGITLYITLNDNILLSKSFNAADLSGVYAQNNSTSGVSYLTLDALSATSASSIFSPVDTGLIDYITSQYTIKFYVKTNSTKKYLWAFNDLIVFQRDCQTCVSKAVSQLMNSTGISVFYTLIIVIILVIILNLAMVYQQYQRKKEFQEKLGATSGNLPHKAIDRVIQLLAKAKKLREKQMNKEARDYAKEVVEKRKKKEDGESAIEEERQISGKEFSEAAKKLDSLRQV